MCPLRADFGENVTSLLVARPVLEALVVEAAIAAPREACGLLLGYAPIATIRPAANVAGDPTRRFEIDPVVLIAAYKAERAGGARLAGFYHSHPSGRADPSAADREGASGDGRIWGIVAAGEVRFWRDSPGGFEPLPYTAVDL